MFPSFLVVYIQKRDPRALRKESKKGSTESIDKITSRVSRPTTASTASRHDFDAQDCHIDYLKKTCELYYESVFVMETTRSILIMVAKIMYVLLVTKGY